ncbi:MAG: hypothetical protein IJM30_03780 [Thermoguttaceae bacterium]|nr:hypothetical protein [Thermoguttaceae bacterium]
MTTGEPALKKLLAMCLEKSLWVEAGSRGNFMPYIPDHCFTSEEITRIKHHDDICLRDQGEHVIANFLPDGERPEGVPDYEETLRRAKRSEDDPKRT